MNLFTRKTRQTGRIYLLNPVPILVFQFHPTLHPPFVPQATQAVFHDPIEVQERCGAVSDDETVCHGDTSHTPRCRKLFASTSYPAFGDGENKSQVSHAPTVLQQLLEFAAVLRVGNWIAFGVLTTDDSG